MIFPKNPHPSAGSTRGHVTVLPLRFSTGIYRTCALHRSFFCWLALHITQITWCGQCRYGHLRTMGTRHSVCHVLSKFRSAWLSCFLCPVRSVPFSSVFPCSHPVLCIIGGSRGRSPTADLIGAARLPLTGGMVPLPNGRLSPYRALEPPASALLRRTSRFRSEVEEP